MADLMGYAMVSGTTSGGSGGTVVNVSTLNDFKLAVADNVAKTVNITTSLKGGGNDPIYVGSNKTISGATGTVLNGVQLYIYTVSNIIIQNIKFKNFATNGAVQIKESAHHIWVDHCEFETDRKHGFDYYGKAINITRESDFCTVSWCKFHDASLSVLISGGIAGHEADAGKLNITMHHNYWYNCSEREPSMNYGRVHMFNNYHLNNGGYSIGTRAGGIVRTDNDYFENCTLPITTKVASDPDGYISGNLTNVYVNCGANNITTTVSTWVPTYEYASVLDTTGNTKSVVIAGAGPR